MNKIFIIIPAFNEEGNIVRLLTDIQRIFLPYEKHIILVDDGSTDSTLSQVRAFQGKMPMEIIVHPRNLGVPKTFYDGIKKSIQGASDDDAIVIIEGDCTSDLTIMPAMIEHLKNSSDIVIASRYIEGGKYKNFPFQRKFGSYMVNAVLKFFFRIKGVSDYSIFYRAYRARCLKMALEKYGDMIFSTKSFAANVELLIKLQEYVLKVSEVPLVYDYGLKKGKSKMKIFKTLFEYKNLIFKRYTK